MLSRTLVRSARTFATKAVLPASTRSLLALRPTLLTGVSSASFSSSSCARATPTPLSLKLTEEINFEKENTDADEPAFLKEFKADGVWALEDVPGADEVVLKRSWENENIRILFSISDLDAQDAEAADEFEEDAAAESTPDAEAQTPEGPTEGSFPVETTITITKPGQGALTIDAVAQDGLLTINNVSFYADQALATGLSAEDDWKRQGLYIGPDFQNLDEGVQSEFENYLEERGINSDLALFIPDFAEYKEQKEYLSWLNSVKGFVEA